MLANALLVLVRTGEEALSPVEAALESTWCLVILGVEISSGLCCDCARILWNEGVMSWPSRRTEDLMDDSCDSTRCAGVEGGGLDGGVISDSS